MAIALRPLQRVDLVRNLASDLKNRYTYTDVDHLFAELNVGALTPAQWEDLEDYIKKTLGRCDDETLLNLAADLLIDPASINASIADPPTVWRDANTFRLFISHLSGKKVEAHRLRDALKRYAISGFVAHDDIEPTADWQREIERALKTSDALIAMLAEGFSQSPWTQQEIGYALARRIKILTFKFDSKEDPKGFVARDQSLLRDGRNADQIAELINGILLADPATRDKLRQCQIASSSRNLDDEIPF